MVKRFKSPRLIGVLSVALVFAVVILGSMMFDPGAHAAPGADTGSSASVDHAVTTGGAQNLTFFPAGVKTPVGLNTPIASGWACNLGDDSKFAFQVALVGTMTGTGPTLASQIQNSYDGGTTAQNVGSLTTINATVTPASQLLQVSDVAASTATVYGDCWRAVLTFGGTGSVGANVSVKGIAKP